MTTQEPVIAGPPPVPVPAQTFAPEPAICTTAAAMTAAPIAVKPASRCLALYGNGVDMRLAEFRLVVEKDCVDGVDRLRAIVEVFGFFCQPGEGHDEDLLQTACLAAPPGSPIARMACDVSSVPEAAARIESILRANIAACPCTQPISVQP